MKLASFRLVTNDLPVLTAFYETLTGIAADAPFGDETSVIMPPEGTRSLTPRLGPFKKGGFDLAIQAGAPIVPIVIRNAGEIQWRNARTMRAGRVQVAVLPPVNTVGWTVADIDEQAIALRQHYLDTLDNWPQN
jgi:putative phosphoserine phosphatase/1-acylglycerol-3-phosphate O-acyltransferase